MTAPQIVLSLGAERDLSALYDYIARDSGPDRADAVLRRIYNTMNNLAHAPLIGRVRRDLEGEPRTFSVWPWLVVYEPAPMANGITVWRVVDGRRDLSRQVGAGDLKA